MGSDDCAQKTLGDCVTLQRGTTYKSSLLGRPGPVLLGLASIQRNGGFRDDSLRTYGGDSPDKLVLGAGDLYVSLKDVTQAGDLLGAVSRVPSNVTAGRLTQDTVRLDLVDGFPEPAYLFWLLRTPQYRGYCRARAIGTTNLSLSREDFLAFPVPPLGEQRRTLVTLLETLEAKIELNRRTNRTLESIGRAIFESWFVDFDPVRRKMKGGEVGLLPDLAALFPDRMQESPLGPVPEGWDVAACADEFTLIMGQSPPGDTYNEVGKGLPFYQGRRDFGRRYPSRRVYCDSPARRAQLGDTLVSVRAPVGDINMATEECCVGRGVAAVRHSSGAVTYSYEMMHSLRGAFDDFEAGGTVFGSVSGSDFAKLLVIAPPPKLVAAYERLVGPIEHLIRSRYENSRTLVELRDGLLPRLMAGVVEIDPPQSAVRVRR